MTPLETVARAMWEDDFVAGEPASERYWKNDFTRGCYVEQARTALRALAKLKLPMAIIGASSKAAYNATQANAQEFLGDLFSAMLEEVAKGEAE